MASEKRRLPVLQNTDDPDEPPRPAWQWVLFDVLVTLAAWVGLAAPAKMVQAKMLEAWFPLNAVPDPRLLFLTAVPQMVALVIATSFGGYLLGRFGGATANVRQAVLAASIVAALSAFIALGVPGLPGAYALGIAAAIVASAYGGALYGRRKRAPMIK